MNMMEKPNTEPQGEGPGIFMEGGKIIVDGKVGSAVEGAIHGGEGPILKGEETYRALEGGKITVRNEKVGPIEGGQITVQNEKVGPIEDVKKIVDMYNKEVGPIEGGTITVKMNKPETKAPTE
jgi:hypothetical protein